MTDTGVKYPLTFDTITVALASAVVWATPSRILLDDAAYAGVTAASFDAGNQSRELRVSNFNISVPATATITGIIAEVERYWSTAGASDVRIILTKDGTTGIGNNYATANPQAFSSAVAIKTCGSSSDLWGTTWAVSDVTASTFGVLYRVGAGGTNTDAFLDYIRTTIHYDTPGGVIQYLAGISSGVATVASVAKRRRDIVSGIAGTATVSGAAKRNRGVKSAIAGVATVSSIAKIARGLKSAIAGSSTTTGAAKIIRGIKGTIAGIATTNIALTIGGALQTLAGIANGIATVVASLKPTRGLLVAVAGIATASGVTKRSRAITSSVAGVATTTAIAKRVRGIKSTVAGIASVSVSTKIAKGLKSLIAGTSTVAASVKRSRRLQTLVTGIATVSSALTQVGGAVARGLGAIWHLLR